jgi:hypothetical protein
MQRRAMARKGAQTALRDELRSHSSRSRARQACNGKVVLTGGDLHWLVGAVVAQRGAQQRAEVLERSEHAVRGENLLRFIDGLHQRI